MSGARPRLGSSHSSSFGRLINARAMASICCSPPLRLPARCVAALVEPRELPRTTARCRRATAAVAADERAGAQVVLDRQLGEGAAALRHLGDARRGRSRRATALVMSWPSNSIVPVPRDHAADGTHRGGLAGAVGAEDDDDLALVTSRSRSCRTADRAVAGGEVR